MDLRKIGIATEIVAAVIIGITGGRAAANCTRCSLENYDDVRVNDIEKEEAEGAV